MLSQQDFSELVEDMHSQKLSLRVATLKVLIDYPSGDKRVLPYLERLLEDKTPCLLSIPFLYGELRWLAAHALAAERAKLAINQPVCLRNAVRPINSKGYGTARKAANVKGRGGLEGVLENFAVLRDMGCLPIVDLKLSDWIPERDEAPIKERKRTLVSPIDYPLPRLVPLPSLPSVS